MYLILSPAKNLNEKDPLPFDVGNTSLPALLCHSQTLIKQLKTLDVIDIQELMGVSAKIAEQNVLRYHNWQVPFDNTAKPALYLFDGDAYKGLDAYSLTQTQVDYLNKHLGILSGLYGLLKPLDLILPYRLEMGTKLKTANADNLYQFWGNTITHYLNECLKDSGSDILVNLASSEYFSAVQPNAINARIITPRFEDYKNGQFKVISFYAKRARGLMARFAAKNQINEVMALKDFDSEGYYFDDKASDDKTWVFRRE